MIASDFSVAHGSFYLGNTHSRMVLRRAAFAKQFLGAHEPLGMPQAAEFVSRGKLSDFKS